MLIDIGLSFATYHRPHFHGSVLDGGIVVRVVFKGIIQAVDSC